MSETDTRRRIRVQASPKDPDTLRFLLDGPVADAPLRLNAGDDRPLARALFAVSGVEGAEVSGATIHVRRAPGADWGALKAPIAAAIRAALEGPAPLGDVATEDDPDAALLAAVRELLDRQANPAIASHGGYIAAERVEDGTVYLRMEGGCQGCAASAATLRDGVERMLRAALPQIVAIVDVTDHASGANPFYDRNVGTSPALVRPVPPEVIGWRGEQIVVDPEYLAPRLSLTAEALRDGMTTGTVKSRMEPGKEPGTTRVIVRGPQRAWAAEISTDGRAYEVPPPRDETPLRGRVRAHLEALVPEDGPITYGALARAMGLWMPGSVRKVTQALEETMDEDAAAGRPFVAARVVSRAGHLPGKGFFEKASALGQGPEPGESDSAFHARQVAALS